MSIRKRPAGRMATLVLLTSLSSGCGPKMVPTDSSPPAVTGRENLISDPFAYCADVGTIDVPDERYAGPAIPDAVVDDLRDKADIAADAPDDWVAAGTVWRCMDGQVWACFVGANLPCSEKADTSTMPKPEL